MPCDEAGSAYIGQPTPVWVGSLTATLRLFEDLELYAAGDWESGHTRISGDVAAAHLQFRNTRCIHTRCDPRLAAIDRLVGQGESFGLAGITDAGTVGHDGVTPVWSSTKYPARSSDIPLATREEAQLIIAEASARLGDDGRAEAIIDDFHDRAGLPDFDPAEDEVDGPTSTTSWTR